MKKYVLLIFLLQLAWTNVEAQENYRRLEITGFSTVKAIPERIVFTIPVKVIDSTYLDCSKGLTAILVDLQKDLTKKGIPEDLVRTMNFAIAENIEYVSGKRLAKGFRGSVKVIITDIYSQDLMSKILETLNSNKLVYSINFKLSEVQKENLRKVAMEQAVADAKKKAVILSESAGLDLVRINKISYGRNSYRPGPLSAEQIVFKSSGRESQNELNLSPPLSSVSKSVLIVWEIE